MTTILPSGFNSLTRPVTEKYWVEEGETPAAVCCPGALSVQDVTEQVKAARSSPVDICLGSTRFIWIIGQESGTAARKIPNQSAAVDCGLDSPQCRHRQSKG